MGKKSRRRSNNKKGKSKDDDQQQIISSINNNNASSATTTTTATTTAATATATTTTAATAATTTTQRIVGSTCCRGHPENLSVPKCGWAQEFYDATKVVKKRPNKRKNWIRLSRAARMMRRWNIVKRATDNALHLGIEEEEEEKDVLLREELKEYQRDAMYYITKKSRVNNSDFDSSFQVFLSDVYDATLDADKTIVTKKYYMNCLQYSTILGDIKLMEKIVSLGASLDYILPTKRIEDCQEEEFQSFFGIHNNKILKSQSALVHGCLALATNNCGAVERKYKKSKEEMDGILECCIQLVRLGANTQLKYTTGGESSFCGSSRVLKNLKQFDGKTAEELAVLSGKTELIDTIREFKDIESVSHRVHCRCGSRLPWRECHAAYLPKERIYLKKKKQQNDDDTNNNRLMFLYSPVARCFCGKANKKTYYKCCWNPANLEYVDDSTGAFQEENRLQQQTSLLYTKLDDDAIHDMIEKITETQRATATKNRRLDPYPIPPPTTTEDDEYYEDMRSLHADTIRRYGLDNLDEMRKTKKKILNMDSEVYAGVMERTKYFMHWRDDHWIIDEDELHTRVSIWNDALEKYCDDMNIYDVDERNKIYKNNKVSPYAPCGNPTCQAVEKKVKEFMLCAKCRSIAYCSTACQKAHWKEGGHKERCILLNANK